MKKIVIVFVFLLLIMAAIDRWVMKNKEPEKVTNIDQQVELVQTITEPNVGLAIGEQAPEFSLETLDGGNLSLQDLKGKVVLLNFWASWCPPCREEMPDMQKVYEQYKDENIEIVAVNMTYGRETVEQAKNFQEQLNLTFPIPLDKKAEVTKLYQIIPIPTSYFIDRDGIIRDKQIGLMTEEMMIEKLEKIK
ncbi:redoxin domain-containing protein [Fervidibacillus halotolerans]|uniref:Redoxin domain-containing protein n=1 Tax=Fervidibacillus halotolerans TaxID=2980027 RepID=A0A9E8M1R0_9BACI|nr:redoxin domain-containing protein [Fervidibacillus halotolerans]WAA13295.1 redoxin domain-containing protein [Fervidibacillus halotolerans]